MTHEEIIAGTLEWCNEQRAAQNREPITNLPAGAPNDPESCPCGATTGLYVGRSHYGLNRDDAMTYEHRLPEAVQEFVALFDGGHFPEYNVFVQDNNE